MEHEHLAPLSDERLALIDRLTVPVWINDVDIWRFRWANRAALEFWSSPALEELVNRPLQASETIRTMFFHLRDRALQEGSARLDHTVYPKGVAVRLQTTCSPYPLPEGRIGLLVETQRARGTVDMDVIRSSEAVRYAPLVVTTHALDGTTLAANALARRTFGHRFRLHDIFVDSEDAAQVMAELAAGEAVSRDAEVRTTMGTRWFAIEARRIPDPVTGADAVVMSAHDITVRREAELTKDELISVVSHEIRTPLTAIRGSISLLSHGRALGLVENEDELFQIALENSGRLGRLVDDLLDVQKLGQGRVDLERARVPLPALVERAIALAEPLARDSGVIVCMASAVSDITVYVDAGRIVQVLTNLLSNAIKYSPRGGVVRVEIVLSEASVRVRVEDRGPGVPLSFRSRIFGQFEQADASSTRPVGGAGLGLYIAKTLVEHHGGRLDYLAIEPHGTAFYFDLPLRPA